MQPQRIVPGVYRLAFEIGQVYLWDRPDGLTVVDSGMAGSADTIVEAIRAIGRQPEQVTEIVLTHCHDDHRGSAAELASLTGATVIAHRLEAPFIQGEQPQLAPDLLEWERPILEAVAPRVPPASPVGVARAVEDGDTLGGGGIVVHVPGHTPGSIALLAPAVGVLFTGDTIAEHGGRPILGVFNVDPAEALRSLQKQAALQFEAACFGHGEPVIGEASAVIRALAESLSGAEMDIDDFEEAPLDPPVVWDIGLEGRRWNIDRYYEAGRAMPEKFELIEGKLFWSERERLGMLSAMLEQVGLAAAVRLAPKALWLEALSQVEG